MFGLKPIFPRWFKAKTPPPRTSTPASSLSLLASAVVLAAGAGVAFWWWTQWARGRAESEAAEAVEPAADLPKDLE
jgi:uncharacterized protein HemX